MPERLTRDQLAEAVLRLPVTEQSALFADLGRRITPGRPGLREMGANVPADRRPQLPQGSRIMSAAGLPLDGREGVAEALADAHNRRGGPVGYVPVASVRVPLPEARTLRRDTPEANSALVAWPPTRRAWRRLWPWIGRWTRDRVAAAPLPQGHLGGPLWGSRCHGAATEPFPTPPEGPHGGKSAGQTRARGRT
jgi:hypothetical protein